ncbi:MAG: NAD(FAD)-utilizing dehydrogenase [Candidatus Peregrinibacteria bacterium GW2011_GWF2_33_10]|nr:MAG: NAD(FAD)-utilizing dehydrogenase [Candidatus Peregrinibacteria bacterium GW2011_GWF2_33_10]OGJ45411.1 MAG: hypothetical protein A2263_04045 [Candidatus Peregrinibacteria bacterium RIFOXYA2_FULL_33_21]OGJ45532.1 MAG: hypothetical protein A2272_00965 [Candidatus Peregrinibacteria bacterium RIFOXYA12_FULL_33_12]OGJ51014.1 MAG: hypothetical protein A2307_05640 [Candidatus Peregrinibacteria bacterium RIFOXYB2_FULL_33_20]
MKIAVIGGGAAGMMAVATIKEKNPATEVFLIEKNHDLGAKVMLTGGGRCNVTTGIFDVEEVLKKYPRGAKFLKHAMYSFSPKDLCAWFENHGLQLKIQGDLRVFPVSDNGQDVVRVFVDIFAKTAVKILLNNAVMKIEKEENNFFVQMSDSEVLEVNKIILTTGGQAYRETGSTGDGYTFAKNLGHTITKLAPSLSALMIKEEFIQHLSGVSLEKVSLRVNADKIYKFTGPIMFTHFGLSGPAIFAMSALIALIDFSAKSPINLFIDLISDFEQSKFLELLNQKIIQEGKKRVVNIIDQFLPKSLAVKILENLNINLDKKFCELSKKEINKIVENLKNLPLTVIGRRAGEEFVTAGGIDLKEVNPQTMESKICPGLYFAGEILDIDGFTGGFNLQSAWSTGRLAGKSADC